MAGAWLVSVALLLEGQTTPPHIGGCTPNSQLLSWCRSKDESDFARCWAFISGVIEVTGMPEVKWPKGHIELPRDVYAHHMTPVVVGYIERLNAEKMSSPAVRSVYEAVVAVHARKTASEPPRK